MMTMMVMWDWHGTGGLGAALFFSFSSGSILSKGWGWRGLGMERESIHKKTEEEEAGFVVGIVKGIDVSFGDYPEDSFFG